MAPLHVRNDTFKGGAVVARATVSILVANMYLGGVAKHDRLLTLGRNVLPGGIESEIEFLAKRFKQTAEVVGNVTARPRSDGTLIQRHRYIAHDELRINLHLGAEPTAIRAGTKW